MNNLGKAKRISRLDRVRNIARITAGCIVLLFAFLWLYEWGTLWYDYQFTGTLFYVMLPDWLVWLEILGGFSMIVLAYFVFKKRIQAGIALLAVVLLFLLTYFVVRQMIG